MNENDLKWIGSNDNVNSPSNNQQPPIIHNNENLRLDDDEKHTDVVSVDIDFNDAHEHRQNEIQQNVVNEAVCISS